MFQLIIQSIILIWHLKIIQTLECLDENSNPVDWQVGIKFPKTIQEDTGKYFLYLDYSMEQSNLNNDKLNYFKDYNVNIDEQNISPFYNTLNQVNSILADPSQTLMLLAFNDDPPIGTVYSARAHAKAVIAYEKNSETGFYFGHSLPDWPEFDQSTGEIITTLHNSQNIYAQSLFCLSLQKAEIEAISEQLYYTKPLIYQSYQIEQTSMPKFYEISDTYTLYSTGAVPFYELNLQTRFNNVDFKFKSKHMNQDGNDLIDDGLLEMLQCNLITETWGRPLSEGICNKKSQTSQEYFNIKTSSTIKYTNIQDLSEVQYSYTQDHSKWVVCDDKSWTCIGDMNKMTSQQKRGGSFFCIQNDIVQKSFRSLIETTHELTNCECEWQCEYKKCISSHSNCLSCKGERYNSPTCQCPDQFYDDFQSFKCQPCNIKCDKCTNKDTCIQCQGNRINFPECECPSGTYFDDLNPQNCLECNENCQTCTKKSNYCIICKEGRVQPPFCLCDENDIDCVSIIEKNISQEQNYSNFDILLESQYLQFLKPTFVIEIQGDTIVDKNNKSFQIMNICDQLKDIKLIIKNKIGTQILTFIKWVIKKPQNEQNINFSDQDYQQIQNNFDKYDNQEQAILPNKLLKQSMKGFDILVLYETQEQYKGSQLIQLQFESQCQDTNTEQSQKNSENENYNLFEGKLLVLFCVLMGLIFIILVFIIYMCIQHKKRQSFKVQNLQQQQSELGQIKVVETSGLNYNNNNNNTIKVQSFNNLNQI